MQAILSNWGDSVAVRLPKRVLKHLGLNAGDSIEIIEAGQDIIIRKDKKQRMKELFAACKTYQGEYDFKEIDCGSPVGGEVW